MSTVLIPYRGDLVTARLSYRKEKKRVARKFKRKLLEVWDLQKVALWSSGHYINTKITRLLGIEKDFLKGQDTSGIEQFGVKLTATADINKILSLSEEQKEFLINKAYGIFNKYGRKISISYDSPQVYHYDIYHEDIVDGKVVYVESQDFEDNDAGLAQKLYSLMVAYMIENDSPDTVDDWNSVNPDSVDFWNGKAQSKLKFYTYEIDKQDISRLIKDRIFTIREYNTLGVKNLKATAKTIDLSLFDELLDEDIDPLKIKELDGEEFLIYIQTHLTTWHKEKPKKWYQKGFFGFIMIVVVVVVAVVLQQYWLIGVALGTALVVAGLILSVTGALIGNEVMMMGGQVVSLIGGGINIANEYIVQQAAMETAKTNMINAGMDKVAVNQIINSATDDILLDTMLGAGKFALKAYSTFGGNLIGKEIEEQQNQNQTPSEKVNELYVCEDMEWDYVNQFMPEFIIASAMKIM
ncbi:hypothetical protein PT520_09675 [Aliarcobacter butzleri]|uniref:Uncharacterized protein n=1 Tax=Aliarcobacter butzleri TaxID=28197 RepID=A0AAW6VQI4_9BACT|nr:hypothetical protein [Aliarcobacter butzleri]MDK2062785.1 hypothetical protein [Aliarcobacter butzleri]